VAAIGPGPRNRSHDETYHVSCSAPVEPERRCPADSSARNQFTKQVATHGIIACASCRRSLALHLRAASIRVSAAGAIAPLLSSSELSYTSGWKGSEGAVDSAHLEFSSLLGLSRDRAKPFSPRHRCRAPSRSSRRHGHAPSVMFPSMATSVSLPRAFSTCAIAHSDVMRHSPGPMPPPMAITRITSAVQWPCE